MSFLTPGCDHERLGHVLAASVARASSATHVLELSGGKLDGLNLEQWQAIRANYIAEMDFNISWHRTDCEDN